MVAATLGHCGVSRWIPNLATAPHPFLGSLLVPSFTPLPFRYYTIFQWIIEERGVGRSGKQPAAPKPETAR
jgi:hypothetical protein